jgi:hypothetical protein
MSTDNVTPIRPADGDSGVPPKYDIIGRIDAARGVIGTPFRLLIDSEDQLSAHIACALELANDELQRARDEIDSLA